MTHAYEVINDLMKKHNFSEIDQHEFYTIYFRLKDAIRNQHITDESYARHKAQTSGVVPNDEF